MYDDILDSHLGKDELTLERFTLTFASPNTQDQGNLLKKEKNLDFHCLDISSSKGSNFKKKKKKSKLYAP